MPISGLQRAFNTLFVLKTNVAMLSFSVNPMLEQGLMLCLLRNKELDCILKGKFGRIQS